MKEEPEPQLCYLSVRGPPIHSKEIHEMSLSTAFVLHSHSVLMKEGWDIYFRQQHLFI